MTTNKTVFPPDARYEIIIVEQGKNGKTYWRQAGQAFPLKTESGGLRLRLYWKPELQLILKESLRPAKAPTKEEETSDIPF